MLSILEFSIQKAAYLSAGFVQSAHVQSCTLRALDLPANKAQPFRKLNGCKLSFGVVLYVA